VTPRREAIWLNFAKVLLTLNCAHSEKAMAGRSSTRSQLENPKNGIAHLQFYDEQ
jgi:hypothetical protein